MRRGEVVVEDQELLTDYLRATLEALSGYAAELREKELSEVIDHSWEPAVTRGVRLVSIIDDAAQHGGPGGIRRGDTHPLSRTRSSRYTSRAMSSSSGVGEMRYGATSSTV